MTTTRDLIETAIRQRGNYLSSIAFTQTYIRTEIQAAWVELYEIMDDTNEGWWDTDAQAPTIASTAYVALPADCWRVKAIDILDGDDWIELRQLPIGYRNKTRATGKPEGFRLTARGADMSPVPDAVYTLRFTYAPKATTLTDSAVEMYGWEEFVIERALLALDERQEKSITERFQRLYHPESGLKRRIQNAASKRKMQEPEYLSLRTCDGEEDY